MRLLAIVVSIDWHTETKLKERAKMLKNPVDSFLCVGLALVDLIVEVDGFLLKMTNAGMPQTLHIVLAIQ